MRITNCELIDRHTASDLGVAENTADHLIVGISGRSYRSSQFTHVVLFKGGFSWLITVFLLGTVSSYACRHMEPASPPTLPAISPDTTIERQPSGSGVKPSSASFAIYSLSRGKGVPPEARDVLRRVQELVQDDQNRGVSVSIETTRIGIEGETRVCVKYDDPAVGAWAYERAKLIVKDTELVNLVAEPCTPPASQTDIQKEEEDL